MKQDEFRTDWEAYASTESKPSATLGDHFKHNQ